MASAMPFLSFLLCIKYLCHFRNHDALVVDIDLLFVVGLAIGICGRMYRDLLYELMQDMEAWSASIDLDKLRIILLDAPCSFAWVTKVSILSTIII